MRTRQSSNYNREGEREKRKTREYLFITDTHFIFKVKKNSRTGLTLSVGGGCGGGGGAGQGASGDCGESGDRSAILTSDKSEGVESAEENNFGVCVGGGGGGGCGDCETATVVNSSEGGVNRRIIGGVNVRGEREERGGEEVACLSCVMGCFGSQSSKASQDDSKNQKRRSDAITRQLQKDKQVYRATHRLLLLGNLWFVFFFCFFFKLFILVC